MTKRQAQEKGLEFTGITDWASNKDKLREVAADIKKTYKTKASIVPSKSSTLLSVYAGEEYFIAHQIAGLQKEVDSFEEKIARLSKNFQKELLTLYSLHEKNVAYLKELREKRNSKDVK